MCPHCRAFITTSDKVCPYCNENVGPRAVERRNAGEMLAGFIPSARFVTVVLVMVNIALYIGDQLNPTRPIARAGAESGILIMTYGQWYRLFTAGYLHGGLLHVLMNMWAMFDLSAQVEEIYGPSRLFVFYTVASVAGFYFSMRWNPLVGSLGASAALFGLIGAMIALGVRNRNAAGSAIRAVYVRWAIYGLLFGLLPGVDNRAHIGGLAAGFAIAYVSGTPGRVRSPGEQAWKVAAGACLLLTGYAFFQLYLHLGESAV